MARLSLGRAVRLRREYRAPLLLDGVEIGRVERGWTTGRRANAYRAIVGGVAIAEADTLGDLALELRDPDVVADAVERVSE